MNINEAIEYAGNLSLLIEKEGTDKIIVDGDTMMTHKEFISYIQQSKKQAEKPELLDANDKDFDAFEKDIKSLPEQVFAQMDNNELTGKRDVDVHIIISVNKRHYRLDIHAEIYQALEELVDSINR